MLKPLSEEINLPKMFSNKTSRSHSVSSNKSADLNNYQDDGSEAIMEVEYPHVDQRIKESRQFTMNHPQGAALLKLVTDITNLAKATNYKAMTTNVDEFCSAFHNSVRLERGRTSDMIDNINHDVEMNILNKELNSHKINASIEPPRNFSPCPVITSAQKNIEILKVFPKHAKFSGTTKDGGMGVVEFLRSLLAAQNQCALSEEEFLERLLAASTGQAHDLILEWKTNGMDTAAIFHNLLLNYDKRLTAEEARSQLIGYKVPKSGNLASAEAHIVKLIGRAATALPTGPSRNAYYNLEGCNALIRALPSFSSQTASNLYNSYTAKLGRACTLLELSQGLNLHRSSIDKDIKENGMGLIRSNKFMKKNNFNVAKYITNSIGINETARNPRPFPKRGNENSYTPRPAQANKPRYTNGANKNFRNLKPKFQSNNAQNNSSNKCTMCGHRSHDSTSCQNIKDDSGKVLKMIPTYATCSKCPNFIKPRLHHPEHLCPFRVGGPLNRKGKGTN